MFRECTTVMYDTLFNVSDKIILNTFNKHN